MSRDPDPLTTAKQIGMAIPNLSSDQKSCLFPLFTGGYTNSIETQEEYTAILEKSSSLDLDLVPTFNVSQENSENFGYPKTFIKETASLLAAKMGLPTEGNKNIYGVCLDAASQAQKLNVKDYTILLVAFSKGGSEAYHAIEKLRHSN